MTKSFFILLGYLVLTAFVILLTAGLVAYGQGYSYDFHNNRLTKNGLVIISTSPSGATVRVQSKFGTKKTPYHASFEQGNYNFSVSKPGYIPWAKTLNVIASQVTLAQYIVLIPDNRPQTVLDRRTQIVSPVITRDHRHYAYIVPGTGGGLYTLDLTVNKSAVKLYTPPTVTDAALQENLTDVSWSDDASHLLLGSTIAGVHTVRVISASDGSQVNLTEKYHFDFTSLQFSARDWRQLYWVSPDGIRRLDLGAQTVTGILADKVSQFVIAGDRVLFVQSSELGESLGALDSRDHKTTVIQALVKSPTYAIKYESYQGQDLLAIVPSINQIGTLYSNIFSSDVTAKVVARGVNDVLYSTDGHLATFYSPTHLVSYDLEQSGVFAKSVVYTVNYPAAQSITAMSYFDGAHLLVNQAGRTRIMEYDGTNGVDLGGVVANFLPYRIADLKAILLAEPGKDSIAFISISIK